MKTDFELAKEAKMLHINAIAEKLNINPDDLDLYGRYKAKIPLEYINEERAKKNRNLS